MIRTPSKDFYKIMLNNIQKIFNKNISNGDNCIDLDQKPKEEVQNWLQSFDTVLTDCDGVLWLFNAPIPGSCDTINKFKDLGKKVYFVTNNSTKTREEFLTKAHTLGYNMQLDEMRSTAYTAAEYLAKLKFNKKVYIVGSSGIAKELDAVGIAHTDVGPDVMETNLADYVSKHKLVDTSIGAVIVGFDEHFSFPKMIKAASYLKDPDCIFIGTNTDERFPMPGYVVPGTGSIVRAIETCAERKAIIMGKPFCNMCDILLLENNLIVPHRTLMIGDRSNTDILFGKNCGFQTLLVGTGIHNLNDIDIWRKSDSKDDKKLIPDYYLPSLAHLLQFM